MGGILFAPLGPPDPHGPVVTAGGEGRVIGRECQAIDLGLVAFQGQEFLPGHGIPEPDLVAPASRGERLAVRGEDQASQFLVIAANGQDA